MKNVIIPPIVLFLLSLVIILCLASWGKSLNPWLYRILGAFSASGLSVVIPGTITIGNDSDNGFTTLAQKSPTLTATGAMAVFVLVYLFEPNWCMS